MCDGKWIMRDRKVLTLDEEAIVKAACEHADAIYKRAGIVLPDRFPDVNCKRYMRKRSVERHKCRLTERYFMYVRNL